MDGVIRGLIETLEGSQGGPLDVALARRLPRVLVCGQLLWPTGGTPSLA